MKMAEHNALGKRGELEALQYLKEKGFLLRHKNWRFAKAEIDLIVENEDYVVLVEVKTRSSDSHGRPESFISKAKQRHLIKAANAYAEKEGVQKDMRFDIIAITLHPQYNLVHIPEAFYP